MKTEPGGRKAVGDLFKGSDAYTDLAKLGLDLPNFPVEVLQLVLKPCETGLAGPLRSTPLVINHRKATTNTPNHRAQL